MHVHVVGDVHELRQVAVLAEELTERDSLPRRPGVGLVWRPEDDDDVATPVRMEGVGAIDVAQLLLEHDPVDDLGARMSWIGQVLERTDDRRPDLRVGRRRGSPCRIEQRAGIDVDLDRAARPAGLGQVGRCGPAIRGGVAGACR